MKSFSELKQLYIALKEPDDSECNFYFVKNYSEKLYEQVQKNEGMLYLDPVTCAKYLRDTLNLFLELVFADNREVMNKVRNMDKTATISFYANHVRQHISSKIFTEDDVYKLNELTNTANHYGAQNYKNPVEISFVSLNKAFIRLHRMMKHYFQSTDRVNGDSLRLLQYRPQYRQIGDYIVYQAETPVDRSYRAQYMCWRPVNGKKRYYIIREYRMATRSAETRREDEVLYKLWNENIEHPQGIVEYERIDSEPCDRPEDLCTFIIYKMNGRPERLKTERLQQWDAQTKLRLMLYLCEAVKNLHSRKIYHRNLQLDSVYVYEINRQIGLNLTGFEFSKVMDASSTVISSAKQNYKGKSIFTAPEINEGLTEEDYRTINWARADIYSLGVLLAYIMSDGGFRAEGRQPKKPAEYAKDGSSEYPEALLPLIRKMCSENEFERPSAKQVFFTVRSCYEMMDH